MPCLMINGINYSGGNANGVELTQLEYDALTEQEKNNGTIYFITDANSNKDGKFQPVIYSESEREIGVWTDGKPLYEKTIHTGAMTTDTSWHTIPHNIENMETPVSAYGYVKSGSVGYWYPIPQFRASTSLGITLELTLTSINYIQNWLNSAADSYVTLRYTKTTNQPGSGQWTPQGVPAVHYSTEEQIVGTWIDGKTLYEQTVIGNAISDTGINILWERTDIDTVVEYNCIFLDGDNLEYNANYYYSTGAYFRVFVDTQSVWTNTKGIVCQRSSNQAINGTRLTIRYTKQTTS